MIEVWRALCKKHPEGFWVTSETRSSVTVIAVWDVDAMETIPALAPGATHQQVYLLEAKKQGNVDVRAVLRPPGGSITDVALRAVVIRR